MQSRVAVFSALVKVQLARLHHQHLDSSYANSSTQEYPKKSIRSVENDLAAQDKATDELSNQQACIEHWNAVYGVVVLDTQVDKVEVCEGEHNPQKEQDAYLQPVGVEPTRDQQDLTELEEYLVDAYLNGSFARCQDQWNLIPTLQ